LFVCVEPRVSKSGFISCNACHKLSAGDMDNRKAAIGDKAAAESDQRSDRAEFLPQCGAVLERPRARPQSSG
jgi:cytochrome c peroxidase